MNIILLILGVCKLAGTSIGIKKRSPESDYWIEYQPIPSPHGNTDSRSDVTTLEYENDKGEYNVQYKDTEDMYPIAAPDQKVHDSVQQAANNVLRLVAATQTDPQITCVGPEACANHTNRKEPAQQICHRALDLGIILDSSYTMEGYPWQKEKVTVQSLIDKLDLNENGVHVAVVVFSTYVEIAVPFNSYKDVQDLKEKVQDIDFMNGWSRTDLALASAKYQLFGPSGGSREGIPKALIVLSDGRTDGESLPDRSTNWTERLVSAVEELKKDGINTFCIATDNADITELNIIASDKNRVFRAADLETLISKLKTIGKQQCYYGNNATTPPQCAPSCVFPSICLLAIQPTCLPPIQQTVTCTIPGSCISTATTTATSTAVVTTTSTDVHTRTAVTTLSKVETQIQTAIETSTQVTTATDTLTTTAVKTSTDFQTITSTDTATKTSYVTGTSTETATSTQVNKTTDTLSTTGIDKVTSAHVTAATKTAIATSTAIATRYVTTTLLKTSLDIDTSAHITTAISTALETSTKTHVTTATETKTLTTTSTALTTSTHLKNDVSTQVLTDTQTLTITKTEIESITHVTTSTGVTTSTLYTTHTKTQTDVATVMSTAVAVSTKVLATTSTDIATSTQVTTATSTKVRTSTATDTKTLTTVSTDVSTSTHITTETSTAVATKTSTAVATVTDTQTKVTTLTSTAIDTSTSIHVTTAVITATNTRTAIATSTAVTTSTGTSTETKTLTTVETSTESLTKTATETSTVMSTRVVTSCSLNCPSTSPTPTLTSIPPPQTSSVTPLKPQHPGCEKELDIGVILDASNNIPEQSFTSLKNFVAQFASEFVVSSYYGSHFGLFSFDGETRVDFKFSDKKFHNPDNLQEKIKGLPKLASGSRIDLAIEKANTDLFSSSGGYRIEKPKALIVFTEERTSAGSKPFSQVIGPLVGKGVRIIAVGITDSVDRNELKAIASGDDNNVFTVKTFDDFPSIMKDLVKKTCDTPEPKPFTEYAPEQNTCSVKYKKLGCYNEQSSNPAMPEQLLSSTPIWSSFASWLKTFVCQCAEKANAMKYTVFGVRDTGECVSGPEAADVYQEYGESSKCVDGHFTPCKNENKKECCGEKDTNYVYGIVIESKPTPITTTPTPKPEEPCKAVVDLVFLIDGSGSIEHFGAGNFDRCKKFVKDMIRHFEISISGTHVGVVLYSSSASVIFDLNEYFDTESIDKAIDAMPYPNGRSYLGNALTLAKSGVIDVSARSDVHRIVIVMTDGVSTDEVIGPSEALKNAGVSIYALGIGSNIDDSELNTIASDPEQNYVFTSGFDDLDEAVKRIKDKACTEASKPLPTPVIVVPNAKFTREPPTIAYIRIGTTVRFWWEYTVNDRISTFARYSPIWYYYYSNGTSVQLASEDKNAAWQWSISSTCPASYKGRISKEGQATLVITSVTIADGGSYGCSLMMASGTSIVSKGQLVLIDARFTKKPAQVVYAYEGETVKLEWLYTIDGGRNNAFARYSPTWEYYYSNGEYVELASEDKNNGWKWSISATCPTSLKGRLSKESDATLVISNVTMEDSGSYGCSLVMVSGFPVVSTVQLVVKEKPKPTQPTFQVKFTKLPPRELYVYSGTTVKFEWEYTIMGDRNQGFARYSPTWNLYNEEGASVELASEDKYNSWKWKVSSTSPASLRGRISKESSAHLIIKNVATTDSGIYECSLELAYGEPLADKVKLIVVDKPNPPGVVTPPCEAVVDLVFLIDGSTSIEQFGMGNFKRYLNFAKSMVRSFDVSQQGTHVGVVLFTNKAKVEFTLTEYFELAEIESAIDKIQYPTGSTFTGEGLKAVKNNVFDVTGRSGVPHALIIMTDGQSIDDIEDPSIALKNDETLIYCLGIGHEYNMQQLNTMASFPTSSHVFVADFDKLDTVVESIKQQVCFDAGSVTPTTKPVTEKPEVKCKTTVDLGFLIDGSTSIATAGERNFDRCKEFVKEMISNFEISESGTHVGVAQFASRVYVNFTFTEYYDKASLNKAVDDIPMLFGGTNLGKALTTARTGLFDTGSRTSVPRILIVMTDGMSEDDVDAPAKALQDQGITIFCLGIGDKANKQQLNTIATDPDSDHVFKSGFDNLTSVLDLVEQKACPEHNKPHSSSSISEVSESGSSSSTQSYSYSYGYCSVRYRKLGCYGDDQKSPRPLSEQLFTDKDPDSERYSGIETDLGQWDQYMSDVVCRCAKNAESRDNKLFGIQNFGECWSGMDAEKTYNRNGNSSACISTKMETCHAEDQIPCVGNKTSNFVYEIEFDNGKQAEACSVKYEKVGCFKDNQISPRPFSELMTTDLDSKSEVYSGSPLNKGDWNTYLADVICRCAQNAQEYEYEYFGIQNLGECWSGPNAAQTYNTDGPSDKCVSKKMKSCINDSPYNCVGQDNNHFVYRIQKTNTQSFSEFE